MPSGHEQILVVADDLTGAADSSLPFAEAGIPTTICLNTEQLPASGAVALVTNTRASSASETEARNFEIVRGATADRPNTLVYQKIDSTLRGRPAHALAGTLRALAVERALVAPAYPEQGRTTVNGQQLVFGLPLEESTFKHEVQNSDIRYILRGRFPSVALVPTVSDADSPDLSAKQVFIADAETDADLDRLVVAAMATDMRVLCGSAGLAKALAKALPSQQAQSPLITEPASSGATLVVIGSRHPTSRRQVEFAAEHGIAVMELTADELTAAPKSLAHGLRTELSKAEAVILTTAKRELPLEPRIITAHLAEIVREVLNHTDACKLVLSGGDTALAVAEAIGATQIRLLRAIEPGIALGRWQDGLAKNQTVVTKAGGFGTDRSLVQVINFCAPSPKSGQHPLT